MMPTLNGAIPLLPGLWTGVMHTASPMLAAKFLVSCAV
jgi:hypothetical protein